MVQFLKSLVLLMVANWLSACLKTNSTFYVKKTSKNILICLYILLYALNEVQHMDLAPHSMIFLKGLDKNGFSTLSFALGYFIFHMLRKNATTTAYTFFNHKISGGKISSNACDSSTKIIKIGIIYTF